MITINFEQYGQRQEFATIDEAQQAIRDCGPEFAGVTLYHVGEHVENERDETVGTVTDEAICRNCGWRGTDPEPDKYGCGCHCPECCDSL